MGVDECLEGGPFISEKENGLWWIRDRDRKIVASCTEGDKAVYIAAALNCVDGLTLGQLCDPDL